MYFKSKYGNQNDITKKLLQKERAAWLMFFRIGMAESYKHFSVFAFTWSI